jgi:hypothetical protein
MGEERTATGRARRNGQTEEREENGNRKTTKTAKGEKRNEWNRDAAVTVVFGMG